MLPADAEISLQDYSRFLCALLNIPVYNSSSDNVKSFEERSLIESLHVVFSMYSKIKQTAKMKA